MKDQPSPNANRSEASAARNRIMTSARTAAMQELTRRHPQEFRKLYLNEKKKRGLKQERKQR